MISTSERLAKHLAKHLLAGWNPQQPPYVCRWTHVNFEVVLHTLTHKLHKVLTYSYTLIFACFATFSYFTHTLFNMYFYTNFLLSLIIFLLFYFHMYLHNSKDQNEDCIDLNIQQNFNQRNQNVQIYDYSSLKIGKNLLTNRF